MFSQEPLSQYRVHASVNGEGRQRQPSRYEHLLSLAFFSVVTVNYFHQAIALAAGNSLWMDEVLAVWAARLPDAHAIFMALIHGSEFSPPLFDLLLHGLDRVGFHGTLAMRTPSIIAMYLAAVAVGLFVKRRSGWPVAALATAFVLTSGIFTYAIQARPYACVTAAIAWALFLWDGLPDDGRGGWRVTVLGLLLGLAVGLHFYAIVLVAGFGVAELGWAVAKRRMRFSVFVAIALAGLSILLWLPIIHASSIFLRGDTNAPQYYGRPSMELLANTYVMLFGYGPMLVVVLLCFFGLRAIRRRVPLLELQVSDPKRVTAALLLSSVPLAIYLFALIVTHSYWERYAPTGALGLALLFSLFTDSLASEASVAAIVMLGTLACCSFHLNAGLVDGPTRTQSLGIVRLAPSDLLVATGNGGRYLELMEGLPSDAARRLIFISAPPGGSDPTNQHEVERWGAIRPSLRIARADRFVRRTPCFLWLVDSSVLHDDLPAWMARQEVKVRWLGRGPARLGLVETRPGACPASL